MDSSSTTDRARDALLALVCSLEIEFDGDDLVFVDLETLKAVGDARDRYETPHGGLFPQKGDVMTYTTERGEYKGRPTLTILDGRGRKVLTFGLRKAEAIAETIGDIGLFVADVRTEEKAAAAE